MEKLFKYQGTVGEIGFKDNGYKASANLVLDDIGDWDKAPVRIEAFGGLANYINEIGCTDAEERYIKADWYYDRNLYLRRIEIPSSNELIPAKVITQDDWLSDDLVIFGPQEYIETDVPEPMNHEQNVAWCNYKYGIKTPEESSLSDRLFEKKGTEIIAGQTYTNHNRSDYLCKSIQDSSSAVMERVKDKWTLVAHGIEKYEDGTIEWDYSTGGHWEKDPMLQKNVHAEEIEEEQEDESQQFTL